MLIAVVFFRVREVTLIEEVPEVATSSGSFAKSLEGSTPDGQLKADLGGDLVLSEALLERFDYYLSTLGERSLEEIRAEVGRQIDAEFSPKAAGEAKRIFGQYIEFKMALQPLPIEAAKQDPVATIHARTAAISSLRARYFSPAEISALFGRNDLLQADALKRLEIERNKSLSAAQRKAQLSELDARLPADVLAGRAPDAKHHGLADAEREARARNASDAELLALRTERVGAEAARQLAELDREEAVWKSRINAYLQEKTRLLGVVGMAEVDKEVEVEKLRQRSFKGGELLRLGAYE